MADWLTDWLTDCLTDCKNKNKKNILIFKKIKKGLKGIPIKQKMDLKLIFNIVFSLKKDIKKIDDRQKLGWIVIPWRVICSVLYNPYSTNCIHFVQMLIFNKKFANSEIMQRLDRVIEREKLVFVGIAERFGWYFFCNYCCYHTSSMVQSSINFNFSQSAVRLINKSVSHSVSQ